MNKKVENKISTDSEKSVARLEEIKDDMKTISTRATWLLGVLVIAILGLANFLSKDIGLQEGSFTWTIAQTAKILCVFYLAILLVYIPLLITPNFGKPIHETYGNKETQENINQNLKILERLNKHFKTLIYLFILLVPAHLIAAWIWYLTA